MPIIAQAQPHFVVDTESERDIGWPNGSRVFCKDTGKTYILIAGAYSLIMPAAGGGTPSDTVVSETGFGQSAAPGSSGNFQRGDHSHGTPTNPVPGHETTYNHTLLHSNSGDHSHANKTLLDTYAQTEVNLGDAVTKKHANTLDHANTNDPTADQKAALSGTSGIPSGTNKYVTNSDLRNADARTPLTHSHTPADVTGTAVITTDSRLSDARAPLTHNQDATTINAGTLDGDRLPAISTSKKGGVPLTGTPSGKFLKDDGTWASAGGGADPWTYLTLSADFTTSLATVVDVTGLGFAPAANTKYEFEAMLMIRTATTTVNPRVGLAWATGMTNGVAMIEESQAAATVPIVANGNINAALLIAAGGLPNNTQSWPVRVHGMVIAGATPSGNVRIQLASETAGTIVRIVAGSFLRYRSY